MLNALVLLFGREGVEGGNVGKENLLTVNKMLVNLEKGLGGKGNRMAPSPPPPSPSISG